RNRKERTMKRLIIAAAILAAACQPATTTAAAPAAPAVAEMPPVTIYHIEGRRSERIVWLMEELGLPYELKFTRGDIGASMAAIRAVNPGMPVAPTVTIGDQVMTESGAIIETIINRYAPGKLTPPLESADYANHMIWMHHAEGSLASRVIADYRVWMIKPPTARSPLVDSEAEVQFAEDYLAKHPWFGGAEFSAADIMMVFPLNFAMQLNIVDKNQFPNINAWKAKIEQRPAYQAMLAKARPDGIPGSPPALPQHAPSGPRPAPALPAAQPAPQPN
ncbi:MAG TPA: glutathione S-transferase, partial [Hyphomonadaceae bacterium]